MLNSAGAFSLLPPTVETKMLMNKNEKPFCRPPQGKVKVCLRGAHQLRVRLTLSNIEASWLSSIWEMYTSKE